MKIKLRFTFVLFLLPFFLQSQTVPDSCRLRLGVNLAGPADWGREFPFKDIMRYGRTWTTHNNEWVGGGQNPWDTDVLADIPLDAEGYPLSLPVEVPGTEAPQVVRTVWDTGGGLPEGTYVVLYDGNGDLDAWGGLVNVVSDLPGRMEIEVGAGNEILALELYESQLGDHIRNIRVLLPGTEDTYEEQPFEENWLEKLEPFQALRFMDWGYTNGSNMRQWSQRTQVNDYTWTQKSGVPYEIWADLCNLKSADAWVCIPHAADDEYVTEMATFFRDNLDPGLTLYVEYSNEVWNWIFEQTHYGLDSLDQSLEWPERLAPRIAHVMEIWTDVFAGQTDRLVRVMGVQHGYFDIGNRIFGQLEMDGNADLVDAISPTTYMGLDNEYIEVNWDENTAAEEVVEHASEYNFDPTEWAMQSWHANAELARSNGKKLVFYEGGHHFTPHVWGVEAPYCEALLDCQTIPEMGDLYGQMFDTIRTLMDEEMLLMHFSFIGRESCQYGTFGLFQNQFTELAPYDSSPKYQAVAEAVELYESCQMPTDVTEVTDEFSVKIYPNPTSDILHIDWENRVGQARLFDMTGREVKSFAAGENSVEMGNLPDGIYFLEIKIGNESFRQIVVKS